VVNPVTETSESSVEVGLVAFLDQMATSGALEATEVAMVAGMAMVEALMVEIVGAEEITAIPGGNPGIYS